MKLNAYLNYNGQCDAAFKFYEKCLGGKIVLKLTCGESEMADKMPPEMHDRIMHVRLVVGDSVLMGSDCPSDMYDKPQGISINIGVETPEEAERLFKALSENGTIKMPIEETFWAKRFGMFIDQFGIPWMINCEKAN